MAENVTYIINLQDKFSGKLNSANKSASGFNRTMTSTVARFASFTAIAAGAGALLRDAGKRIMEFEATASNLAAITGATGDDLDFLKQKAIDLGMASTKSAVDTLEAFKLIASAKPELLSNSRALASVTKEAIALSEASGLDLPEAATALTTSMNQFSLSSDQASRVINVLAAGSKFAAAEIPDLSNSLKEFGGVAESMGLSIEQSAAAVETLSMKGVKGQRAGIQLRNVLLKLGASSDKNINPKVVGLANALENLADIQDDTTKLTKMFGRQNVLAAQTIIKNRDKVDELTTALTGTNIAYEQQRINTDNLKSDVKKLDSAWEGLVLSVNEGNGAISKSFRGMTQSLTEGLAGLKRWNEGQSLTLQLARGWGKALGILDFEADLEIMNKKSEESIDNIAKKRNISEKQARSEYIKTLQKNIVKEEYMQKILTGKYAKLHEWRKTMLIENLKLVEEAGEQEVASEKMPIETNVVAKGLDKVKDQVTKITSAAPKVFNININNLVEQLSINSQTVNEGAIEMKNIVEMELTKAVADVQARA